MAADMIAVPATSAKAGSISKTFVFLIVFAETLKVWFITFLNRIEFVLKQVITEKRIHNKKARAIRHAEQGCSVQHCHTASAARLIRTNSTTFGPECTSREDVQCRQKGAFGYRGRYKRGQDREPEQ